MKRSNYISIFLILLFLAGCQSMPQGQEPTVLVDSRQQQRLPQQHQSGVAEKFLAKAAHFLRGAMPESGYVAAQTAQTTQENPHLPKIKPPTVADSSPATNSQTMGMNPAAFYPPFASKVSRPNSIQASQMLFNFDLAGTETESNESELEELEELEETTPAQPQKKNSLVNLLQPQHGDSEPFRQLLKLIAKTPKNERGVDDAKLEQLLTKFRTENWEEIPELETSYILHLRNRILPNYRSPKKLEKPTQNQINDEEDEFYVETDEADDDNNDRIDNQTNSKKYASAPLPPSKSTATSTTKSTTKSTTLKNTLKKTATHTETTDLSDEDLLAEKPSKRLPPAVFKTATESANESETESETESATELAAKPSSLMKNSSSPENQTQPVYPKITQLEGSQPIVPAGYQTGQHPPHNNQFGNQFGNQFNNQFNNQHGNQYAYSAESAKNGAIVHADYTNFANNPAHNPANNPANNPNNHSVSISPSQFNDKDWEFLVRMGADRLRNKIERTSDGRTFANEGRLRVLEMLLGNRNEAVKPIAGTDRAINEFMANQMLGFTAFFDETGIPEQRTRNTHALFRFDEGLMELRKICPIKLKKVQFVRGWGDTFGNFIPRNEDCHAGEQLELYMEPENPSIRRTQQGYNVSMSISYEIRDQTANVLQKIDHITVQETSLSQKRDYCIWLRVLLPEKIPPGQYQLRVSVTDTNDETMPYTEEQVPFKVIPIASPEN
ncbi:MAG: hypothetical protein LBI18_08970 [Planctomycetaceae bacterium]|jgi:hypothetical protein|nr:hypothetical protein [Planctomycetaceae bacterium]